MRGWQRAGAWAALVAAGAGPDCPVPSRIIASATDRGPDGKRPRRRPALTVEPLAARLGLPVEKARAQGEEAALAHAPAATAGTVPISWEHKRIPAALLAAPMGPGAVGPGVSQKWDPARFDVVVRLDRPARGPPFACRQLFPCLLAGDTAAPLF